MSKSEDDVPKEPIPHEVTQNVIDDDDVNIGDLNIGGNTGPNAKPLSGKQSSDEKQKKQP